MESQKARKHRLQYLKDWRKKNYKYVRAFDKKRWKEEPNRRARHKKYHSENPEKYMDVQRKHNYGISPEEYDRLVKKQGNRCALCGRKEHRKNYRTGKRQTLSIDHCHVTGKNRALLCVDCNIALGLFRDDEILLLKAVQYLKRHKE